MSALECACARQWCVCYPLLPSDSIANTCGERKAQETLEHVFRVGSARQMVTYESQLGGTAPAGTPQVSHPLSALTSQSPLPSLHLAACLLFPLPLPSSENDLRWAQGVGRHATHDRDEPELGSAP